MTFQRGERFGRFVIEAFLGSGGMGRVYRAYDEVLERRVALKVLAPEESSEASARILREARAAAALDHPNVVSIHDVGEVNHLPYLAMEYVAGSSLRQCIGAPLPFGARVRILLDVARALAAAHEVRLVHRDVKPENVMIRSDGVVKVLDFGIARKSTQVDPLGATAQATSRTAQNTVTGTPAYMAPEQMRGETVDARADQFSWGIVAFELLVGARPWGGQGIELLAAMLSAEPARAAERDPSIPPALDAVIARCLSRDRDARFASMNEVIAALEPLASSSSADIAQLSTQHARRDSEPGRSGAVRTPTTAGTRETGLRAWALGAGAIGIAAGVVAVTAVLRQRPGVPSSPPATIADAAVTLGDLPAPKTASAEAASAYVAALEGTHRGALISTTIPLFLAATRADPALGAAHLRAAVQIGESGDTVAARAELVAAEKTKSGLTPRDAEILDAYAPCVLPDPIDPARCLASVTKLAAAHPHDAEIVFLGGLSEIYTGDMRGAASLFDRALAIDPDYGAAMHLRSEAIAYSGDFASTRRSLEECMTRFPLAESCARWRPIVDDQEGDRAACERDARALRALSPGSVTAQRIYAEALLSRGGSVESVLEVLGKEWSLMPEGERALREERDRAAIDAYEGRFDDALARLDRNLDAIVASSDPWRWRQDVALYFALLEETGRARDGGGRATKLRRRLPALDSNALAEDWAIAQDALPILLDAEYAGGAITRAERSAASDAWLHSWDGRVMGDLAAYPWVYARAELARTPEEARDALRAVVKGVPGFLPLTASSFAIGRTYLLAGDRARAIPLLRSAANGCSVLSYPMQAARARALLGDALGESDRPGACGAYAEAIAQWGGAKRSATAERARQGKTRLGCP